MLRAVSYVGPLVVNNHLLRSLFSLAGFKRDVVVIVASPTLFSPKVFSSKP